jgi:methylmalonyl-CoA decarboxylase subunit alpha
LTISYLTDPRQPYDVRDVIKALADDSEFFEVQELFAANIVIGFGTMNGETVGLWPINRWCLAGVLDVRFIR